MFEKEKKKEKKKKKKERKRKRERELAYQPPSNSLKLSLLLCAHT
jgi:hypothetical protein